MTIYYVLYSVFVSIWILMDAPLQNVSKWWALGALILPFIVPYYFVKTRPLNRYWKFIGLWLLGFFIVHAIGTVMVKVQTTNVHRSSNQLVQWKTFVADDKSFTVQFPTEPNRESDIVNAPSGKVDLIQYMSKNKDILYSVMYGDYPSNALLGLTSDQLLDNARNGAVGNVQGKLLSEVIISKANYPGR